MLCLIHFELGQHNDLNKSYVLMVIFAKSPSIFFSKFVMLICHFIYLLQDYYMKCLGQRARNQLGR